MADEEADGPGKSHEIWMFPADELIKELLKLNEELKSHTDADIVALSQLAQSGAKVAQQVRLLGAMGRAYVKIDKAGRKYIIFKGLAGLRPNLAGTRYAASNPKISCFVVGSKDIVEDAAKGTKVAIIAFVVIDVIQELSEDKPSLASLGVRILSDVIQAVAAAAVGAAAGVLLTTIGAPTVIAFAVVVAVGFGVGVILTQIDRRFQLTERARRAMMEYETKASSAVQGAVGGIQRRVDELEEGARAAGHAVSATVQAGWRIVRLWRDIEDLLGGDPRLVFQ